MTVRQAVEEGVLLLKGEVDTPLLDVVLLLSKAIHLSRERLVASYPDEISPSSHARFRDLLDQRHWGKPVSYITGKKEFYSHVFTVDSRVLVPRPDTEILVEAIVELVRLREGIETIHDCCTGSGCIGISIQHELPDVTVTVSDISTEALALFAENSAAILDRILTFWRSDLLTSVPGRYDVIVANPPYLDADRIDAMAATGWPEPLLALDGGIDGLASYRTLIPQSRRLLRPGGYLFLEADPGQFNELRKMLVQNGFSNTIIYKDLAERERAIRANR